MTPGQIILVDWRGALADSGEPHKRRPAIVIGSPQFFGPTLPFVIVVPLTGESALAIAQASTPIEPTVQNGCTKRSYALAWNVQTIPHTRITETPSHVNADELAEIRAQVSACIDA